MAYLAKVRDRRQGEGRVVLHDRTMPQNLDWLDFFHGGVPPYQLFRLSFDELSRLAESSTAEKGHLDTTAEVCLIGLAAYFEAFSKDQFAAIMNICPETLKPFGDKRPESSLPLRTLRTSMADLSSRVGSLVSEQYDFGSAKTINGLFLDLLNVDS